MATNTCGSELMIIWVKLARLQSYCVQLLIARLQSSYEQLGIDLCPIDGYTYRGREEKMKEEREKKKMDRVKEAMFGKEEEEEEEEEVEDMSENTFPKEEL